MSNPQPSDPIDKILFSLTDQSDWDLIGITQAQSDELSEQLGVDRAEAHAAIERMIADACKDEISRLLPMFKPHVEARLAELSSLTQNTKNGEK